MDHATGTGDYRKHDRQSQVTMAGRAAQAIRVAQRDRVHLWIATVAYRITDPTQTNGVILDHESLFTPPALGCMVCEEEYRPGMERTACPGEPE